MRNSGNCWEDGWLAATLATVPSVTPAPADGVTVTMEVTGLDATVTVWVRGFDTGWGLMRIVCIPAAGLTRADGRLCNSCRHHHAHGVF